MDRGVNAESSSENGAGRPESGDAMAGCFSSSSSFGGAGEDLALSAALSSSVSGAILGPTRRCGVVNLSPEELTAEPAAPTGMPAAAEVFDTLEWNWIGESGLNRVDAEAE